MINKQEALDSLECFRSNTAHILGDNDEKVKTIETCMMLVREAEETPSAQPERKTGKWIPDNDKRFYKCSECKEYANWHYNYCPNCGAKMEEK